ncbi:MAG: type II secretion system protein [Lachnospiraceae bacterium]|nr:type II secretion system protein [Lachnospiraceae bacterium]
MRQNNRGYSLVELVVVIAIMAVLTGFVVLSVSMISTKKAKQCRDELESKLEYVRTVNLSKSATVANIYKNAEGEYVLKLKTTVKGVETETEYPLDSKGCTMRYSKEVTAVYSDTLPEVDDTGIFIEFDRSSGAIKKDASDECIRHIYVTKGNKTYGIKFYQETGKMEME